ncbi:MAG: hypothetical protein O2904_02330 [bacterium]|nr:hypothetical protein [bacterium]
MRETFLILITSGLLLSGSTHIDVLTQSIVPEAEASASNANEEIQHAALKDSVASRRYKRLLHNRGEQFKAIANTPKIHPAVQSDDILMKHQIIVSEALYKMPVRCQSALENFYVRYDNPEHRGLGGKSTIILTGGVGDDEFRALFLHEFGHMVDLGCLQGTQDAGVSIFRDGDEIMFNNDPSVSFYAISWKNNETHHDGITDLDFVSGYANWDMFEDFAESFTYYSLHRRAFYNRALENPILAKKYNWFVRNLPELQVSAQTEHVWAGQIPWDTTKLAYNWLK